MTRRYRIRPARIGDARGIAEVHVASWRAAYRGVLPDSYLDRLSVEERADQHRAWLAGTEPGAGALVVDMSGVLGFASYGRSRDDDASPGTGEVPAIHLHPEVVGAGIGRHLLAETESSLRQAAFRRATLWVLETNERARRFYERAAGGGTGPSAVTTSTARTSRSCGTSSRCEALPSRVGRRER